MSKETLSFISRTAQDDIFEVVFASYLKKDFISRALTLIHDSKLIMRSLRFHSNDGGIAVWENGKGIISANSWEDEDAGIDPDSLMRFRFPLLNGAIAPDLARETIIHDVISHLRPATRFLDAPMSEPSDIPIFLLAQAARRDVKMVLTGEGSDEVFAGYPKHVAERYASPVLARLPQSLRRRMGEAVAQRLPYRRARMSTAVAALSIAPETERFDQASWLADNLLERDDRMTMAASLEARAPFLDEALVAYVSSLPDRLRVSGTRTKVILREAVKTILPETILNRPKVGFRVPVGEWFRGPLRGYLADTILSPSSRTKDFIRADRLASILAEHQDGSRNHEKLLWTVLALELWMRECLGAP
jgi:asparagine synthase (glutamine-hydrolysing)